MLCWVLGTRDGRASPTKRFLVCSEELEELAHVYTNETKTGVETEERCEQYKVEAKRPVGFELKDAK